METIFQNETNTVRAYNAGEGEVFGNAFGHKDSNGREAGQYLVVSPFGRFYHDTRVDAYQLASMFAGQVRFRAAKDAGLNDEFAELVANRKMTLEAALGDMDMDSESEVVNEYGCPVDPDEEQYKDEDMDCYGGEDYATPPLEIIMAGGQAAWDYQNEKNAWLDSRLN